MSDTPAVSVIVPVYNSADCLGRAVESVLGQTLGNLELILIDDGSSDGSQQLCDDYAARDPRVRTVHQANAGVAAATNTGLDLARGEYVAFLDHDDYLSGVFCERLYRLAVSRRADICRGTRVRHDPDGSTDFDSRTAQNIERHHSLLFFFGTWWSAIYRRELINRHRLRLRPGIVLAHDLLFQNQVVLRCRRWALCKDREAVYHWCYREGSADFGSPTRSPQKIESVLQVYPAIVANIYRHQNALDVPGMCHVCISCADRLMSNARKAERPADAARCRAAAVQLVSDCPEACRRQLRRFLETRGIRFGHAAADEAAAPPQPQPPAGPAAAPPRPQPRRGRA